MQGIVISCTNMTADQRNHNVRLLACLAATNDEDEGDYRFLVDRQHVKYINSAPGAFRGNEDDRAFEPILLSKLLPQFPLGEWNSGHIAWNSEANEDIFISTETVQHPGVKNVWHSLMLNELDFECVDQVRQRVRISTHPGVNDGKPVLVKLAVWPWEVPFMEIETSAYQWIRDTDIGPKFLGHVTEGADGRVIGFVTEFIEGARTAGPDDLEVCERSLARLHAMGIKSGDINKHNFLIRDGRDAVLIDLEFARQHCSPEELEQEMDGLKISLQDTSFRGGRQIVEE